MPEGKKIAAVGKKLAVELKNLNEKLDFIENLVDSALITNSKEAETIKENLFQLYKKLQKVDNSSKDKVEISNKLEKLYKKVNEAFEATNYKTKRVENMKETNKTSLTSIFESNSLDELDLQEDASVEETVEIDEDMDLTELFGDVSEEAESDEDEEKPVEECGMGMGDEADGEVTITLVDDEGDEGHHGHGHREVLDDDADMGGGSSMYEGLDDETIVEISEQELQEALSSLLEGSDDESGEEEGSDEEVSEEANLEEDGASLEEDSEVEESVTGDVFGNAAGEGKPLPKTLDQGRAKEPSVAKESMAVNLQLKKKLQEANRKWKEAYEDLAEMNLLNAKLICATQLLKDRSLTESQMDKVVELLDGAESVDQAKEIYGKLVKKLNERKSTVVESKVRKPSGSSSRPTGRSTVITEGADEGFNEERWERLAGIKK